MKKNAIIFILLLAAAVRIGGLIYHEPFLQDHDEKSAIEVALGMGKLKFVPHTFSHAYFFYVILFFEYAAFFLLKKILFWGFTPDMFVRLYLEDMAPFLYIGRLTMLFFGIGVVYLIYLIGKSLFGRRIGFVSSFFAAFSLGLVQMSCTIKSDIPSVFFLLLSFLVLIRAIKKKSNRALFFSFFTLGIAAATKFHTILGLSFLTAGVILYFKDRQFLRTLFLGYAFTFIGLSIGCPFVILKPALVIKDTFFRLGREYILGSGTVFPALFHLKFHLRNLLGIPLEICALAGVVYALFKRGKEDIMLVSFIAVFFALFFNSMGFAFHLIPAVPFLIILAARFLSDLSGFIAKGSISRNIVLALLTIAAISPTLSDSAKFNFYLNSVDTRDMLKKWVEENVKGGSTILVEGAVGGIDLSTVCALTPSKETLMRDLRYIEEHGGDGYMAEKRIEILNEKIKTNPALKTYQLYKIAYLNEEIIDGLKTDYIIVNGFNDVDHEELAYPKGYLEWRKHLIEFIKERYGLEKVFSSQPSFTVFYVLFMNRDYKALRSIRYDSLNTVVKGPELRLYKLKRAVR